MRLSGATGKGSVIAYVVMSWSREQVAGRCGGLKTLHLPVTYPTMTVELVYVIMQSIRPELHVYRKGDSCSRIMPRLECAR